MKHKATHICFDLILDSIVNNAYNDDRIYGQICLLDGSESQTCRLDTFCLIKKNDLRVMILLIWQGKNVIRRVNTDSQTNRQTNRQTDRQAGRQAGRQTDRQTDRQTERERESESE